MNKKGILFVISGPSGTGKDTILEKMADQGERFFLSVSATTRAPRKKEKGGMEENGKEYYFLSKEEFEKLIAEDGLFEYACYCDCYYGTPIAPVKKALEEGTDVFLEIDVQGALKVMKKCPECVSVFVLPPSMQVLSQRLYGRNTDSEEKIQKRLANAAQEIAQSVHYNYIIVNDDLQNAVDDMKHIIHAQHLTACAMEQTMKEVLEKC